MQTLWNMHSVPLLLKKGFGIAGMFRAATAERRMTMKNYLTFGMATSRILFGTDLHVFDVTSGKVVYDEAWKSGWSSRFSQKTLDADVIEIGIDNGQLFITIVEV